MDRKALTTILALVLIGSFFMPYLKDSSMTASGYEIVSAPRHSGLKDYWLLLVKYVWLLIPLSGIMLLIGAANNGRYIIGRWIWAFLPLAVLLFVIAKIYMDAKGIGVPLTVSELITEFAFGFWIAFAAAVILAFYWPGKKA